MEQTVAYEVTIAASVVILSCVVWWLQRRRARELHAHGMCVRKQHRWFIHDDTITASFCNVCRLPIEASIATCFACGACVHEPCTQQAQKTIECKLLTSDAAAVYEHQLTSVNVAANTYCECCNEVLQNDAEFSNVRCAYCHVTVHRGCISSLGTQRCRFGAFREFVIAPNEVRLKRRRGVYMIDKVELRPDFLDDQLPSTSPCASNSTSEASGRTETDRQGGKAGPARRRPLIVIVNRAAGNEHDGMWLLHRFRSLLNPAQIYDVAASQPLDVALGWLRTLTIPAKRGEQAQREAPCSSQVQSQAEPQADAVAGADAEAEATNLELCMCVCGGDGTLQYVMNVVEQLALRVPLSFVPIPLGTGNDLARQFGWGGGFVSANVGDAHHDQDDDDDQLAAILHQLRAAKRASLDRWTVDVFSTDSVDAVAAASSQPAAPADGRAGRLGLSRLRNSLRRRERVPQRSMVMNNYFSVGLDAAIAFDFDRTRRTQPALTGARWLNKLWYFVFGTKAFLFDRDCAALHRQIGLLRLGERCDVRVPELQCLLVLNIANWCAGCRPWTVGLLHADSETDTDADADARYVDGDGGRRRAASDKSARRSYHDIDENLLAASADDEAHPSRSNYVPKQRVDDGRVEVLGFRSVVHMSTTRINVAEPIRIGQSSSVTIRIDADAGTSAGPKQRVVALQVDGEPWLQTTPCLIRIRHRTQVSMLKRCADDAPIE